MPGETHFLDITLLGTEYRVACPPEEKEALSRAAALVDGKMREIAEKTRSQAIERLAVMAALNVAHEFLSLQDNPAPARNPEAGLDFNAAKRRIAFMEAQIDAVVTELEDKPI